MGIAATLRSHRIRSGKSRADLAAELQLNPAWIQDLERRDDELASTLSLFQAMELAAAVGTDLRTLFAVGAPAAQHVSIIELPGLIRALLDREGRAVADLEEELGWEILPLLEAPLQVATEMPLAFLQAVATRLGIPWSALIAEDEG
jgi:transcriptional regulator with XRE-family HTH domain